jgi:peroxiredoxin
MEYGNGVKARYLVAGIIAMLAMAGYWLLPRTTVRPRQATLTERVGVLPDLPRDKWVVSAAQLAAEIRALTPGPEKTQLIRVLADRVTERRADPAVVKSIADTAVEVVKAEPSYARGPLLWSIANLAHYDRVAVPLDDPDYRSALDKLETLDRQRRDADFLLPDKTGQQWSLHQLRRRVVLVNFWTTWCGPCRREMPDLQALYERFVARGLVVLAITNETPETVAPFLAKTKYTFPVLFDDGSVVNKRFAIQGIPQSFIYNRQGRISAHAVDQQSRDQFLAMLREAGLV